MLFIPAASDDSHPVPAIVEENKLYFNPCIISLMFTWDPHNCITWDVYQEEQPNAHNIDQDVCDTLKVPITIVSDADIICCETCWICLQRQQGKALMDIMQRIIYPAKFEDAMESVCEVTCMWYEWTKRTPTYIMFNWKYP